MSSVNRKLVRKHCDENGKQHLDILPNRVLKSVEEFDRWIAEFNQEAA